MHTEHSGVARHWTHWHEQFGHLELLADAARLDTLHRVPG
jgi:hypothetical protein